MTESKSFNQANENIPSQNKQASRYGYKCKAFK